MDLSTLQHVAVTGERIAEVLRKLFTIIVTNIFHYRALLPSMLEIQCLKCESNLLEMELK